MHNYSYWQIVNVLHDNGFGLMKIWDYKGARNGRKQKYDVVLISTGKILKHNVTLNYIRTVMTTLDVPYEEHITK